MNGISRNAFRTRTLTGFKLDLCFVNCLLRPSRRVEFLIFRIYLFPYVCRIKEQLLILERYFITGQLHILISNVADVVFYGRLNISLSLQYFFF